MHFFLLNLLKQLYWDLYSKRLAVDGVLLHIIFPIICMQFNFIITITSPSKCEGGDASEASKHPQSRPRACLFLYAGLCALAMHVLLGASFVYTPARARVMCRHRRLPSCYCGPPPPPKQTELWIGGSCCTACTFRDNRIWTSFACFERNYLIFISRNSSACQDFMVTLNKE